jgi:excisionase family DNA binding protein
MPKAQPEWITTKQAAEISGYHAEYIRRLIRSGDIEAQKLGRDWVMKRADLLAYVRSAEKKGRKRGPKSTI